MRKTGHDVWKRHAYCDCRIEYASSTERYDVENFKKITTSENREKIVQRKAVQTADDRTSEKIAERKRIEGIVEGQNYKEVVLGESREFLRDPMDIIAHKLENSSYDMWLSEKVHLKRKRSIR